MKRVVILGETEKKISGARKSKRSRDQIRGEAGPRTKKTEDRVRDTGKDPQRYRRLWGIK